MAGPKYYDRIRQLQADRWSVFPFNFKDLADGSHAGRAGLWLFKDPSFVTKTLRTFLPVLKLGKFVIATRFDDVREILDTHDVFDVPLGLEVMETSGGANFILGMKSRSEGQDYERQKRFMNAAFLHGDLETIVKPMAARF